MSEIYFLDRFAIATTIYSLFSVFLIYCEKSAWLIYLPSKHGKNKIFKRRAAIRNRKDCWPLGKLPLYFLPHTNFLDAKALLIKNDIWGLNITELLLCSGVKVTIKVQALMSLQLRFYVKWNNTSASWTSSTWRWTYKISVVVSHHIQESNQLQGKIFEIVYFCG